jgi:hypothetical protein
MRRERDGTSTLRALACAPARTLAATLLLVTMMATYHTAVLAEPIYYVHMHGYGIWQQKFDTAAAACEHYRVMVLAANDSVGNKPGTAVITKLPPEDIYPNLRTTESCVVFWSYPYYSQYYSIGVLAGGCLPGRRPKETVPPESFFAEPWGCEDKRCPVDPLTPYNGPDPYPLNVNNLSPRMAAAVYCLQGCTGQANVSILLSSAYRPPEYQAHLQDVWDKRRKLLRNNSPECAAIKAQVEAEFATHQLGASSVRPAGPNSCHTRGECVDVNRRYVQLVDLCTLECQVTRPLQDRDPVHVVPF